MSTSTSRNQWDVQHQVTDDLTDALAMSSASALTSEEVEASMDLDRSKVTPPPPPSPPASAPTSIAPKGGWVHFAAGGVGGMCGAVVTSPLDVVKTRLQSDMYRRPRRVAAPMAPRGAFASVRSMAYSFVETGYLVRDIGSKEGIRALFKGLGPTLVGVVPARSINFYTYGNGKQILANYTNNGIETPLIHLSAAAFAGVVTATLTNPIWVVKTRLQLERARHSQAVAAAAKGASWPAGSAGLYTTAGGVIQHRPLTTTSAQMVQRIVSAEGIKGLYKGITASYLGVTEGTLQWTMYEQLKKLSARPRHSHTLGSKDDRPGVTATSRLTGAVGSAGIAKLVAALVTYPHEVLRTRMRQEPPMDPQRPGHRLPQQYNGLAQTFKVVVREEGASALYGGLSAHLLRVVPNATVMFGIYELFLYLTAPPDSL